MDMVSKELSVKPVLLIVRTVLMLLPVPPVWEVMVLLKIKKLVKHVPMVAKCAILNALDLALNVSILKKLPQLVLVTLVKCGTKLAKNVKLLLPLPPLVLPP